jgi:hypothetical protein
MTATPALSRKDAWLRVARARYGNDWIGRLNERERWLIDWYVEGKHRARSSVLPGHIRFIDPHGRDWANVPGDSALCAEIEKACDRRNWMWAQADWVLDWFERHGFSADDSPINKTRFEKALTRDFPSASASNDASSDAVGSSEPPMDSTPLARASLRPSSEELDAWMTANVRKDNKRDPAIKDCCDQTGARWRDALSAYQRLPAHLRRTRGERDRHAK